MQELKEYILLRASKKTGKVDMHLEGLGCAVLKLWALQNTPKSKISVIAEKDTNLIVFKAIGDESGFPKIIKQSEDDGEYLCL